MKNWSIQRCFRVIILGVTLLSMLLGPTMAKAQGSRVLDLVLLIDSSGSMADTDPQGVRVEAAYFLLDYAQAVGETQGSTHRFAAANFNDDISGEVNWTPLEGNAAEGLLRESSTGGTNFVKALDYAATQFTESPESHAKAVIIFTDGDPDPADPDLATYFEDEIKPRIKGLPSGSQVYVVATGVSEEAEDEWKDLLPSNHYHAIKDDIGELDGFYHDILTDLLGLAPKLDEALESGSEKPITIEPYLEQVVFAITKQNLGVRVTLQNPLGNEKTPIRGGAEERHEIYVFDNPTAGKWRVQIEGGTAQVWVDRRLPTLHLEGPAAPQALEESVDLTGWLEWGGEVVNDPDLALDVKVVPPIRETMFLQMDRQSNGYYKVTLRELDAAGVYTLTLSNAQVATRTVSAHTPPITVSLQPVPRIVSTDIQGEPYHPSQSITVTATISNVDRIDPITTTVLVEIKNAAGHVESSITPQETREGLFLGTGALPSEPGEYRVEWVLAGRTVDGVDFEAQSIVREITVQAVSPTPEVTSTLTPTPTSPPPDQEEDSFIERYPVLSIVAAMALTALFVGAVGVVIYRKEERKAQQLEKYQSNLEDFQRDIVNALKTDDPEQAADEIGRLRTRQQEAQDLTEKLSGIEKWRSKILVALGIKDPEQAEAEIKRWKENVRLQRERVADFEKRKKDAERELEAERQQREIAEQKLKKEKQSTEEISEELNRIYEEAQGLSEDPGFSEDTAKQEELKGKCDRVLEKVEKHEMDRVEPIVENVQKVLKLRIEKGSGDDEGQLNQICKESFGDRGSARLRALSNYLLTDRWTESVEIALEESYHILKKGGSWKLLSLISSTELDELEAGRDFTSAKKIKSLSNPLVDVLSPSDKKFGDEIEDIVANVRDAFEDTAKSNFEETSYLEDGHKLWSYLSELTEQLQDNSEVLPVAKPPELSDNTLDIWSEILEHTSEAFTAQEKDSWLRALGKLKNYAGSLYGQARKLPEGRVLATLAEDWHDQIKKQEGGRAEIKVELAPILSIEVAKQGGTTFAVKLTNDGKGPTSDIRVRVTSIDKPYFKVFDSLNPGEITSTKEIFAGKNTEAVDVKVTYTNFAGERVKEHTFPLASSEKLSPGERDFENPYVREDRPLRQGDPFVGERREETLRKIKKRIREESGMVDNLWGIRRIGKTSLIYHLLDDVKNGDVKCVPVYMKSTIFDRREIPWTSEDFLLALAKIIEKRLVEADVLNDYGLWARCFGDEDASGEIINEEIGAQTAFQEYFMREILTRLEDKDKKLLLVFDDADVFGEKLYLKDKQQFPVEEFNKALEIFDGLAHPSPGSPKGFFAMFVTDISVKELWRGEAKVSGKDIKLEMLERDDLQQLLRLGKPIRYSELAEEYLWQVTGGHPGLTQLICGEVIYEWRKEESEYGGVSVIPLSLVRKVVRDLTENVHLWGYYRYIYRYSIPKEARRTMKRLIENGVDAKTLQIEPPPKKDKKKKEKEKEEDKSIIENFLNTQQIVHRISNHGEKWFLRVGFFYLGREAWLGDWWGLEE